MRRIDATAHADLVRAGETSPRELVEAAIERVESMNGELNAVIHPLFDKALADEPADGPFRGVPIVVKDLVAHTAGGTRSTSGSGCCARSSGRSPRTGG